MSQKKVFMDIDKCTGCRSCEIACAVEHSKTKDLFTAIQEDPLPQYYINVEYTKTPPEVGPEEFPIEGTNIPINCRHCNDAPCMTVCPTDAITREKGEKAVTINEDRCIGCNMCAMVCPFGAIKLSRIKPIVSKCDLCRDRVKKGKEPACVEACPTGALKFLTEEKLAKERRAKAKDKVIEAFRRGKREISEEAPTEYTA